MFCGAVHKKNHYFKEHRLTDRHTDIGLEKNILGNRLVFVLRSFTILF